MKRRLYDERCVVDAVTDFVSILVSHVRIDANTYHSGAYDRVISACMGAPMWVFPVNEYWRQGWGTAVEARMLEHSVPTVANAGIVTLVHIPTRPHSDFSGALGTPVGGRS